MGSLPRGAGALSSVLPMREMKGQFIERTLKVWQPRTVKVLTAEQARQIAENATGFFKLLMQWEADEQDNNRRTLKVGTDATSHFRKE